MRNSRTAWTKALAIGVAGASVLAFNAAMADPGRPFAVKGAVRPGPDMLYAKPAASPQLSNAGIWKAAPILVSGASAYRNGEFLYQDYLYDDRGAAQRALYPETLYDKTHDNAADFVELRVKPGTDSTAIRISYNTLIDPDVVATTIALGDAVKAAHIPSGAGGTEPATIFVTVHGKTATITDAASGSTIGSAKVSVDMLRRQVEVRVPYSAFDTRGKTVRIAAGTGLWDAAKGAYLTPEDPPAPPPPEPGAVAPRNRPPLPPLSASRSLFFNVAFRYHETLNTTSALPFFSDVVQADQLAKGDLSSFYADVDFAKLASGKTDDSQIPAKGFMSRIIASHFETIQGRAKPLARGAQCTGFCPSEYSGRLQPYEMYIPQMAPPASGYGLTLDLHSADASYARWIGQDRQVEMGERGTGSIVITPFGRGLRGGYTGQSGADVFEVWHDVASRYKIDPQYVSLAGVSMGTMGMFKFAGQYPDLFAAMAGSVGCPSDPILANHSLVAVFVHTGDVDTTTNCHPGNAVLEKWLATNQTYQWWNFLNQPHPFSSRPKTWQPFADFLGMRKLAPVPSHVVYAVNSDMDQPEFGLNTDHAYWLSGVTLRDLNHRLPSTPDQRAQTPPYGIVDAVSHGMGVGDPVPNPVVKSSGTYNFGVADYPWQKYNAQNVTVSAAPSTPKSDSIDVKTENVASLTIDPKHAGLDCKATINLHSDGPVQVHLLGCAKPHIVASLEQPAGLIKVTQSGK